MKSLKFLLVDDSESTNFFNKMMIERTTGSKSIKIARDGEEALTILNTNYIPDVILLDINMPKMNGWEFLNALKQLNTPFHNVSVILMLGAELPIDKKTYIKTQSNIIGCLDKMLNKTNLIDLISRNALEIEKCSLA